MSPDEQVVQTLYESLKSGDPVGMAECYREVKAHWVADYKFKGVNQVNYGIDARFTCREGKIVVHRDEASRWFWSKQAIGFPKDVLVTVFPSVLQKQAREELKAFLEAEKNGKPV